MKIKYSEYSFINRSKKALIDGEPLEVEFEGRDAKYLAECMQVLKEIQNYPESTAHNKSPWWMYLKAFMILLTRLYRFVVIFWLALSSSRCMKVKSQNEFSIDILFSKDKSET